MNQKTLSRKGITKDDLLAMTFVYSFMTYFARHGLLLKSKIFQKSCSLLKVTSRE